MTTDQLTRKGARGLTTAIDRVAECVQNNHNILGIDPKIAMDFAYRCDLISDAVETTAVTNHPLDKSAEYAADEIGAETKGPIYQEDPSPDLKGQFTQKEFQQLTDEVEGSSSPKFVDNGKKLAGAVDAVLAADNSLELITAMETLNTELDDVETKSAKARVPGYSPMQLKQEIDRLSQLRQEITTHTKQFEDVIKRLKDLEKEEKAGLANLKKAAQQMREKGKYVFEAEQGLLEFTAYMQSKTPGIAQMIEDPNDPKSKYGDKAGDMFGRIAGQLGQEVADQVQVIYDETKEDLTHTVMAVSWSERSFRRPLRFLLVLLRLLVLRTSQLASRIGWLAVLTVRHSASWALWAMSKSGSRALFFVPRWFVSLRTTCSPLLQMLKRTLTECSRTLVLLRLKLKQHSI